MKLELLKGETTSSKTIFYPSKSSSDLIARRASYNLLKALSSLLVTFIAIASFGSWTVRAGGCGGANFTQPAGSPISVAGNNPRQVVVADFNLDGKPDIAVTPTSATGGSIYLGNGNGGFGSAKPFSAVGDLVVGDFNGDGKPDLATLLAPNQGSNKVTILLGDGNGGFSTAPGSPFSPPSPSGFFTVGDLNLDGKLDLALLTVATPGAVTVMLGNGSGGFSAAAGSPIAVGSFPNALAVADINVDGKPDLVVINDGSNNATILFGNGAGAFSQAPGSPVAITPAPSAVVVGDFNLDGKPDLAVGADGGLNVTIYLGNGSGGFVKTQSIFVQSPLDLATADFNLDGLPDLAIADRNTGALILLGDGTGHFPPVAPISVGTEPESVAIADFNLDGRPDFAMANFTSQNISIELNTCTAAVGTLQFSTAAYSVNENGAQATISVTRTGVGGGAASVSYATSDGTATAGQDYSATSGTLNWAAGDSSAKTFTVPIVNDTLNEASETVNLTLNNPTGGATLGSPSTAVLTIIDNDPQPSVAINDVSQAEGNGGTTSFNFSVSLSAASGQMVTVNYGTADGTAQSGSDYQPVNSVLTFAPGETSKTISVQVNGDTQIEPNETFFVNLSNPSNATISKAQGTGSIVNDDSVATPTVQFSAASYSVQEDLGALTVTVTRSGDTSGSATVDYATNDGVATQKGDFELALGTLNFAPGDTSKTFQVLINEDMYPEGNETFGLTLSNPTGGAALGSQSTATATITDDSPESITNPIDDAQSFVYQHYHDMLNREPDAAGLAFWTNQITACGADQACIDAKRADVSAAFYLSIEFQNTGYLVYRTYKAAFGNMPGAPVPLHFKEFVHDTHEVGDGVVVNQPGWDQVLESNKQAFMTDFVQRVQFVAAYPASLTPMQFVDALATNAGITPSSSDRQAAINEFGGSPMSIDAAARARALRDMAENPVLTQQEFSKAFVLMQYFGYLRRDPDAAPDSDLSGYNFWLNKLNQFNGDYSAAQMVKAFITSGEYRQRFGL